MMTVAEKKESRRIRNHQYYIENHVKWQTFYPRSEAAKVGTSNIGAHREDNFTTELIVIEKEMIRLGLKTVRAQAYKNAREMKK